jgi:hypothetical protein
MYVDEWEHIPECQWPTNIWLYNQMRTDEQAAALLTSVMWGIAQLRYVIDPNGCRPELVQEISKNLNLPIMGEEDQPRGRMKARFSHNRHIINAMLAAIFGHMYFEQVGNDRGRQVAAAKASAAHPADDPPDQCRRRRRTRQLFSSGVRQQLATTWR